MAHAALPPFPSYCWRCRRAAGPHASERGWEQRQGWQGQGKRNLEIHEAGAQIGELALEFGQLLAPLGLLFLAHNCAIFASNARASSQGHSCLVKARCCMRAHKCARALGMRRNRAGMERQTHDEGKGKRERTGGEARLDRLVVVDHLRRAKRHTASSGQAHAFSPVSHRAAAT